MAAFAVSNIYHILSCHDVKGLKTSLASFGVLSPVIQLVSQRQLFEKCIKEIPAKLETAKTIFFCLEFLIRCQAVFLGPFKKPPF